MSRFLLLPILLFVMLGPVHVLPERGRVAESAVRMDLPLKLGDWRGVKRTETQEERDILAKDTEFAKVDFGRRRIGATLPGGYPDFDRLSVSVVLSGYDINNSIHRPERCLPAQGHTIYSSRSAVIDLDDGRQVKVRKLNSKHQVRLRENSDEIVLADSLTYYFFVGHDRVTNDHYERTFIDMKDRLLKGRDQRWAYVTIATSFGSLPWSGRTVSREDAEKMLQDFCGKLLPQMIDWDQAK